MPYTEALPILRTSAPKSLWSTNVIAVAVPPALVLISCGNNLSSTNVVELFAPSKCASNLVNESFTNKSKDNLGRVHEFIQKTFDIKDDIETYVEGIESIYREIEDEDFCPWAGNIDGHYFIGLTRQTYQKALREMEID